MAAVRFATAEDGVSLAWTRAGSGPPLVKAATWLTHLDYDYESPIWAHQVAFFEKHFDYLRFDERGCGLSDRETGRLDLDTWVSDMRKVVEAADLPRPFSLLAQSQGTGPAIAYAARYPEDVATLFIYGGYARGVDHRGDAHAAGLYHAMAELLRQGFDDESPAFRHVFTSRFVPDGDPERSRWFSDLLRVSTTADVVATLLKSRAAIDATAYLPDVRCPTYVLHGKDDVIVPLAEGRLIAQGIPGAEFIVVPSENHILQAGEPAWETFCETLLLATGRGTLQADLTPKEQAILDLLAKGMSNKAIARDLDMSEKTVRNHLTHVFAKLGVSNRAEAMLKAARR